MLSTASRAAIRARLAGFFANGGFVKSVSLLVGGTAFAQALTVLALPVTTRLYTPHDFSVLAVYVSILTIVSSAACLRFELAIPMPEHDEDAVNLLGLALGCSALLSILAGILILVFRAEIISLVKQPALLPYLWLVPLGSWLASSYAALLYWSTRYKRFKLLASTRIAQAIGGSGTQIGLGFAGIAPFGLLLGHMISSGAGAYTLIRVAVRENRDLIRGITVGRMRHLFKRYAKFPKYATFEVLANNAGIHLPVIIIAAISSGPAAGYLLLANRAMAIPMSLIGAAVAQVYVSRAPKEHREGNLGAFTLRVISGLVKLGLGPLICLGIAAPVLFPVVFGGQWRHAGDYIAWMIPWFVMQFITSPVSMTLDVTGNQRWALALQLIGIIVRIGAVLIAARFAHEYIVEAYAVSGFVFYSIYLMLVASLAKIRLADLFSTLLANRFNVLAWLGFGVALRFSISSIL